MANLYLTKFRATSNLINRGSPTIIRRLIPNLAGSNYDFYRSNIVARSVFNIEIERRFFSNSALAKSAIRANVDSNNILRSPFEDVGNFTDTYMHDFVWRNMDRWHDKTALECSATGRSYTYAQMRKFSGRLATALRKNNLRPGDTIAAILPNVPEYGILILATSEAGLRITLVNPAYTTNEIRNQLRASKAAAIFTVPSKYSTILESIVDNKNVKLPIIVIDDGNSAGIEGTIKFRDLISDDIEEFSKTGKKTGVDPEDTLLLPYSSGTSGLPKGVELSHRNIVASMVQLSAPGVSISMETTANHQEILPVVLPMYHIYGLVVCLSLYLCSGAKIVCVPQFSPENLFKVLEEYRSTLFYAAPPLVQLLVNDERLKRHHVETIRTIVSGAAPIGDEVLAKFQAKIPSTTRIVQGYGLTECSPVVSMSYDTPPSSTGSIVPNTEIRIVGYENNEMGKNLSFKQVGEIYVKGPQVMKGYYENPEATKNSMENGWFKTGDLGCYDENGFLYINGRLKELIKVQGYQVAPAEIEDLIQGHEKVADAAVIGVPHEKYGQIPMAFVVAKSGVQIDPREIQEWVAERVAKYKRLGDVKFIEKIPKSATGKILRRELVKLQ